MKLMGKKTIITGGASGMGKATAELFAKEGASVAILDIDEKEGNKTIELIKKNGGEGIFLKTDVSNAKEVNDSIDNILKVFGEINILFNHAGTIIVKPLHESTEEDYDYLMNINVRSAFLVCNKVIPLMLKNGGGNIVIT